MKARLNGRNFNFKTIGDQIIKYGKLIKEVAQEYDLTEGEFLERLKRGLDPKIYAAVIRSDERNQKNRQPKQRKNFKEATTMTKTTLEELCEKEKKLQSRFGDYKGRKNSAEEILLIRNQTFEEVRNVFEQAREALEQAKKEKNAAAKMLNEIIQEYNSIEQQIKEITAEITELKNQVIYLVDPKYIGDVPEYGTFISIAVMEGIPVHVEDVDDNLAGIEPEFKDMLTSGYDSLSEYMQALKFVMLCASYTLEDKEFQILTSDERLKKLLKIHLG